MPSLFLLYPFARDYRHHHYGKQAVGTITEVYTEKYRRNTSRSKIFRRQYNHIIAKYRDDTGSFQMMQSHEGTGKEKVGDQITVFYGLKNTNQAIIDTRESDKKFLIFSLKLALFGFLLGSFLISRQKIGVTH